MRLNLFKLISLQNKNLSFLCTNSTCSHLCLASENTYNCYCPEDHSSHTFSPVNKNSGYCKGRTLVAVYGNNLFIIGLYQNELSRKFASVVQKQILNITSISAITYDSIKGEILSCIIKIIVIYIFLMCLAY